MEKSVFSFLALLIAWLVICPSSLAVELGNVAIIVDKSIDEDFSEMSVQLEGEPQSLKFGRSNKVILWNINPGGYNLQLAYPDSRPSTAARIYVYPGLTTRILIKQVDQGYYLSNEGFADRSGQLITLTRKEIKGFSGEFPDGIGRLGSGRIENTSYAYDGLLMTGLSRGRLYVPSARNYPDMVLVNLGDPFAGEPGADINLISRFNGPEKQGGESIYATRDGRFNKITVGRELPRQIGSLFGSISFENLDDASPRSNVTHVLPHNDAENVEFMGGGGFRILTRFKADARMYYKSLKRNYYDHDYYFDIDHAPRDKAYTYKSDFSLYGWVRGNLFARAGFGIGGDDYQLGDGGYLDDLKSYLRPDGNPLTDINGLFWQWDDYMAMTENTDESHVNDQYKRYKTGSYNFRFGLSCYFRENLVLSLNSNYEKETFRKFAHFAPTVPEWELFEAIGFESDAETEIDGNGFDDVPRPRRFEAGLTGKWLGDNFAVMGSLDFLSFSSRALSFIDPANPTDPVDSTNTDLTESDMKEAGSKNRLGYRLGVNYSLLNTSGFSGVSFFGNFSTRYIIPDYTQLYFDPEFFEFAYTTMGFFYPYGNPDLDPIKNRQYEVGLDYSFNNNAVSISYRKKIISDYVEPVIIPANIRAYEIYANSDKEIQTDALIATFVHRGEGALNGTMTAQLVRGDQPVLASAIYPYPAMQAVPNYMKYTSYKLSGNIVFDPGKLSFVNGSTATRDRGVVNKILDRLTIDGSFCLQRGLRYTVASSSIFLIYKDYDLIGLYGEKNIKDFFEVTLGLSARLLEFAGSTISFRIEVLNVFDRDNYTYVYSSTGEPNNTGWLSTPAGQQFIEDTDTVFDNSGLTGEEKYRLAENDPNNFGRPRIFRIMAKLEF
nr:TonB-dependent receptor [candidate division Zixibacteria bacterium]